MATYFMNKIKWLPRKIKTRLRPSLELENIYTSLMINKLLIKQCSELIAGVQFVGQELQDMYAYLYFRGKRDGFFVDIGAYDGITISNTYALERIGWKGLCVEPIPDRYHELVKNRKCDCVNVAIYNEESEQQFLQTAAGRSGIIRNMSKVGLEYAEAEGIVRTLSLKTVSFNQLMRNYGIEYIDFMSIDVEGSELGVLESIDFNRYKFGLITIENNAGTQVLKEYMIARGYKIFLNLGCDLVFIPDNTEIGMYWWVDP